MISHWGFSIEISCLELAEHTDVCVNARQQPQSDEKNLKYLTSLGSAIKVLVTKQAI
jgi:hypothetical protein